MTEETAARLAVLEKMARSGEDSHKLTNQTLGEIKEGVAKISAVQDNIVDRLEDGRRTMDSHDRRITALENYRIEATATAEAEADTKNPIMNRMWQLAAFVGTAIAGYVASHFTIISKP